MESADALILAESIELLLGFPNEQRVCEINSDRMLERKGDRYMWGGYMGYGPWGSAGFVMTMFMAAFWIVLLVGVGAIVWTALRKGSTGISHSESGSALRILEERYARGEIGKEEFEEKRRDLQGGRH